MRKAECGNNSISANHPHMPEECELGHKRRKNIADVKALWDNMQTVSLFYGIIDFLLRNSWGQFSHPILSNFTFNLYFYTFYYRLIREYSCAEFAWINITMFCGYFEPRWNFLLEKEPKSHKSCTSHENLFNVQSLFIKTSVNIEACLLFYSSEECVAKGILGKP